MQLKVSAVWYVFVGFVLVTSSVAYCAEVQIPEVEYLREASRGHLDDVFLLKSFGGFVAFPRTSIVENTSGPGAVMIEIAVEGYAHGWAHLGSYVQTKDGKRVDVLHSRMLPANASRSESRGKLTVEYFGASANESVVLVHDCVDYILLTGSATLLTNEFVEASVALTGPPDLFSTGWHPLHNWSNLPVSDAQPPRR